MLLHTSLCTDIDDISLEQLPQSRTAGCYGKGIKCLNFISKHWTISNVSSPFCTLSSNVWESHSLARSGHRPQFLNMSCHGEASICGPSFEQDCSKPFIGKCPWFQIESEKLSLTRTTGFNSKLPLDQKKKKWKLCKSTSMAFCGFYF